jgi:hypothetical protein
MRIFISILAAFLLIGQARAAELTDRHTDLQIVPLETGASTVRLVFDLESWGSGATHIIRHFCPPGVEMFSPGFAILRIKDDGQFTSEGHDASTLRRNIRLTNIRNMVAGGQQGASWYLRNDGPQVGPVRLEISFVARDVAQ